MLDGTYDIAAETPLGTKQGSVTLTTAGSHLLAEVRIFGMREKAQGEVRGDAFRAQGAVTVLFTRHEYVVEGSVEGPRLTARMVMDGATMTVSGLRRS